MYIQLLLDPELISAFLEDGASLVVGEKKILMGIVNEARSPYDIWKDHTVKRLDAENVSYESLSVEG